MKNKDLKYVIWDHENESPFLLIMSESKRTAFGLFIMTSNPVEVRTLPSKSRLIFRILGDGIFNLFVYNGPTPKEVISQHY